MKGEWRLINSWTQATTDDGQPTPVFAPQDVAWLSGFDDGTIIMPEEIRIIIKNSSNANVGEIMGTLSGADFSGLRFDILDFGPVGPSFAGTDRQHYNGGVIAVKNPPRYLDLNIRGRNLLGTLVASDNSTETTAAVTASVSLAGYYLKPGS